MVGDNFNTLIGKIKNQLDLVAEKEGNSVLAGIELGKLYVDLRTKVRPRQWEKTLRGLNVNPRVASRYLTIGGSWWATGQALGTVLLAQMPCDVQKLESLSRLSPESLPTCLKLIDCKTGSRGAVISAVKRLLNESPAASEERQVTVKILKKRWDDYIHRIVDAIDSLDDQDIDEQARQELLDEFLAKFTEVEEALQPEEAVEDQSTTLGNESSSTEEDDGRGEQHDDQQAA